MESEYWAEAANRRLRALLWHGWPMGQLAVVLGRTKTRMRAVVPTANIARLDGDAFANDGARAAPPTPSDLVGAPCRHLELTDDGCLRTTPGSDRPTSATWTMLASRLKDNLVKRHRGKAALVLGLACLIATIICWWRAKALCPDLDDMSFADCADRPLSAAILLLLVSIGLLVAARLMRAPRRRAKSNGQFHS